MTKFKNEKEFLEYLRGEAAFDFKGWPQEKLAKLVGLLLKVIDSRTDLAVRLIDTINEAAADPALPPADVLVQVKAMARGETALRARE